MGGIAPFSSVSGASRNQGVPIELIAVQGEEVGTDHAR